MNNTDHKVFRLGIIERVKLVVMIISVICMIIVVASFGRDNSGNARMETDREIAQINN